MDSKDFGEIPPLEDVSKREIYLSIIRCLFTAGLLSSFIIGALLIPAEIGWGCISGHCPIHSFHDILYALAWVPLWIVVAAFGCVLFSFPSVIIGGLACLYLKKAGVFNFYTLFLAGCLIATLNGLAFWLILSGGNNPNIVGSGIFTVGGAVTAALAYTDLKKIDRPND
jgi:hypothetical protein